MSSMNARVANGHTLRLYVPDDADVATEGIYPDDSDTHHGIFIPKRFIDDWSGSPLTDGQMNRLANTIQNSSIPDAISTITGEQLLSGEPDA
jgi:hypothetical protein